MSYRYSQTDTRNIAWFGADNNVATLRTIKLRSGRLRSISPFTLQMSYPITAIAGENGSGKTTILGMAACAFHNSKNGYKLAGRNNTYYTFQDFLIHAKNESAQDGILINYEILSSWKGRPPGPGWQMSKKNSGGKWSNYDRRVDRNVVYFGIERLVPYAERSAHRSYRNYFMPSSVDVNTVRVVRDIAGRVLGKRYSTVDLHEHSKYRLPFVTTGRLTYSGFNMGAGENAVISVLVSILEAGRGSLIVIDEIELGLHEKAQRRFIKELKGLCNELHCQIICSTHSPVILESLPPEARFFVEHHDGATTISPRISPRYACGKLAGNGSEELAIFVEDDVAESMLAEILPLNIRERVRIIPIGSDEAVIRQLSARYRERREDCIAFLDGDKSSHRTQLVNNLKRYLEGRYRCPEPEMNDWIDRRLHFLPGKTWPEKWLLEVTNNYALDELEVTWKTAKDSLSAKIEDAIQAGKHNELYTLSESLHKDIGRVRVDIVRFVEKALPAEFARIQSMIGKMLE